jgi:hypothetical protein
MQQAHTSLNLRVLNDIDKCIPFCNPNAATAMLVFAILLMHSLGQSKKTACNIESKTPGRRVMERLVKELN